MLRTLVFGLLVSMAAAQTTVRTSGNVAFDCGVSNVECAVNGTCPSNGGQCTCDPGFIGHDCAINSSLIVTTDCQSVCQNGATCFTQTGGTVDCYCPDGYYGDTCENKRVTSRCTPSGIEISIAPFFSGSSFLGFISVVGQDVEPTCVFDTSATAGVFIKTINFRDCGGTRDNTLASGDVQKTFEVLLSHDGVTTERDTIFAFGCVIKAPGTTINRNLQEVVQPDSSSLPKKEVTEELFPFTVRLTDLNNNLVSGPQPLGTLLKLTYTLNGGDVYDRFRVEDVTVANGLTDRRATVEFVTNTCATEDAVSRKKVLTDFSGDPTRVVSITFKVFKLRFSNNLVFENTIRLCNGTGPECDQTECANVPFEGLGRRKRSADDVKTQGGRLEKRTTKIEVFIPGVQSDSPRDLGLGGSEPDLGQCVQSLGFLILAITSLVLFLLVVAVFVIFCVRMLHKSAKASTKNSVASNDNFSFTS